MKVYLRLERKIVCVSKEEDNNIMLVALFLCLPTYLPTYIRIFEFLLREGKI